MEISKEIGSGKYRIISCNDDGILINESRYQSSFIVMSNHLIYPWKPQTIADLQAQDWSDLLSYPIDVVLLGTGAALNFPHPAHTTPIIEKQWGMEVMDTAACCRTYNILMAEERRVAAAIMPIRPLHSEHSKRSGATTSKQGPTG